MNAYPQSSFEIRERLWSPFQFRNMLDLSIPHLPLPYLLRWQRPPLLLGGAGPRSPAGCTNEVVVPTPVFVQVGERRLYSAAGPRPRGTGGEGMVTGESLPGCQTTSPASRRGQVLGP